MNPLEFALSLPDRFGGKTGYGLKGIILEYASKTLSKIKNYMVTSHPKLFEHVYWGNFDIRNIDLDYIEIFQNRDKFVDEFQIVKRCKNTPQYVDKYIDYYNKDKLHIDHREVYENQNVDYVLITSPYDSSEGNIERHEKCGWKHIYPIYGCGAVTFVRIIPKRKRNN